MILSLLLVIANADWTKCLDDWKQVGLNIGQRWIPNDQRNDYGKMAAYSGLGLNDIGMYERCVNVDIANYVLL